MMPLSFDLTLVGLLCLAYLSGSIASAVLISRALQTPDPRQAGSGNPGATNVLRLAGPKAALATLLADAAKAALPTGLAVWLQLSPLQQGWVGLAALLGHSYPLFFRLRGGKGVASALGVLLVLSWPVALVLTILWGLLIRLTRIASVATITCALLAPLLGYLLAPEHVITLCAITLLLGWRHSVNIRQLRQGTERRF